MKTSMTPSALAKRIKNNPIALEADDFEKEVKEIQSAIRSVDLSSLNNAEDRLRATKLKLECMDKLATVLLQLKELRKEINDNISDIQETRGKTELSPLERNII